MQTEIRHVLQYCCNTPDILTTGPLKPLYSAILSSNNEVLCSFLELNFNLNARITDDYTVLHITVMLNNIEGVCMLLYYNADVSLLHNNNATALNLSLDFKYDHITEVLLDYYDEIQCINALLAYIKDRFFAAFNEVTWRFTDHTNIHFDVIINWTPIFEILFEHETYTLFKIMWPKFSVIDFNHMKEPLLITFFQSCNYSQDDFLQCCYLILDSPNAVDVVGQFNNSKCCLWHLLVFIDNGKYEISRSDRLGLIYAFLSFGIKITLQDTVYIYNNNGYNEETMALIYGGYVNKEVISKQKYCVLPVTSFIFVLEENSSRRTIFKMFRNLTYRSFAIRGTQIERFLYFLRFFSFSPTVKEKFVNLCKIHISCNQEIINKIKSLPTIRSLLEISRNKSRYYIKRRYKIKRSYQFHDVVKRLNVPTAIKNIITYKTPIYN